MIEVREMHDIFVVNGKIALQADRNDAFVLQYRAAAKLPWIDAYKLNERQLVYKPPINGLEHRVVEFSGALNVANAKFLVTDDPSALEVAVPTEAPTTEAPTTTAPTEAPTEDPTPEPTEDPDP